MKRTFIAICLAVSSLLTFSAQARTFGWGVCGGMNVSKIDLDNDVEDMTKPEADKGWYAGLTTMVSLPVLGFGIDGSVVYSQEKVDLGKELDSKTARYLSIPVHIRYDINLPLVSEVFVPYTFIGPQFNYAMNDVKVAIDDETDTKAVLKKANSWRLDLGLGFILMDHVQLSYSYGIPVGSSNKITWGEAQESYKMGSHRVGLAVYF